MPTTSPLRVVSCEVLPEQLAADTAYRLVPRNIDKHYYLERTNRNLGWITPEEQTLLRNAVVGIAGCGGMGGFIAAQLFRLGVGEVRIADCETFDVSNINRQFGAMRTTLGESKAGVTARLTRDVTDDGTLMVFPQGITEQTADAFIAGCTVLCDEIEFWAAGSRILLHQRARARGIPLFNCNSVGFGSRLFLFTPNGMTMEELLDLSYEEASLLQEKVQARTATRQEVRAYMQNILTGLIHEVPEYSAEPETFSTVSTALTRLLDEQRAPIIATNPLMASGFLANHIVFELLKDSGVPRVYPAVPPVPGYRYYDAGFGVMHNVTRTTVSE